MPTPDTTPQPRPRPRVVAQLMDAGGAHVQAFQHKPGGPVTISFYATEGSLILEDQDPAALRQLLTDAIAQLDAIDGAT